MYTVCWLCYEEIVKASFFVGMFFKNIFPRPQRVVSPSACARSIETISPFSKYHLNILAAMFGVEKITDLYMCMIRKRVKTTLIFLSKIKNVQSFSYQGVEKAENTYRSSFQPMIQVLLNSDGKVTLCAENDRSYHRRVSMT